MLPDMPEGTADRTHYKHIVCESVRGCFFLCQTGRKPALVENSRHCQMRPQLGLTSHPVGVGAMRVLKPRLGVSLGTTENLRVAMRESRNVESALHAGGRGFESLPLHRSRSTSDLISPPPPPLTSRFASVTVWVPIAGLVVESMDWFDRTGIRSRWVFLWNQFN